MAFDTIHETHISDIVDVIKNGVKTADSFLSRSSGTVATSGSLTKATKGLIMEFPVLVSKANHIESAGIVAKAYEAKFVTLLQLAFSAMNFSTSKDALQYLKNFHTNLDYDKLSVDDFMNIMDNFVQHNSANMTADSYAKYKAVTEDMRNLCYTFEDDINESSLNSYKVMNNYGRLTVVSEKVWKTPQDAEAANDRRAKAASDLGKSYRERDAKNDESIRQSNQARINAAKAVASQLKDAKVAKDKADSQIKRNDTQNTIDTHDYEVRMLPTNLLPTDVKKANEMVPTMLVINFVVTDTAGENTVPIYQSVIIGVKAKLYEVEPTDVINKIIAKRVDSNLLLKLIKVGTREVSFVKDFLLAIDDAKLDALSRSKKGSTNKLFKVLERRAIGGRIRKTLKMNNYAKAISSLVISQEEAEALLKNNIDVTNPSVMRPIMEQLNLISFAIIDESSESVKFIWDTGDDTYETIPLSKLEREQSDGMSKKVINLMAKMNR